MIQFLKRAMLTLVGTCSIVGTLLSQVVTQPGSVATTLVSPTSSLFIDDISGKPFLEKKDDAIKGSPLLLGQWHPGTVIFRNGQQAKDLQLLFNVNKNVIYFKRAEVMLEFVQPIKQFTLRVAYNKDSVTLVFRNGYVDFEKNNADTYYEVLVDGSIQLLKQYTKTLLTYKPYNQPEQQEYSDKVKYFVFRDNKFFLIKRDKEFLIRTFPDLADKIRSWCEANNSHAKTEPQLVALIGSLNK